MDFYEIKSRLIERGVNKGKFSIYPDFKVSRSKDLMVRGRGFYAVWDEETGLWSTDEYDVQRLMDEDLYAFQKGTMPEGIVTPTIAFESSTWKLYRQFIASVADSATQLDQKLTFANTDVKKSDFISRRLPYDLAEGDISAWDELVGTLYSVSERAKIEWTLGAIISGDSKKIQKFLVLYGPGGTGKSTILNIVEKLFVGYTTSFEAKALGSNNNAFATEVFKENPLVAIQHDGDLSKIEDNSKLNSIISHEDMTMNEKYKASYTARINAFLLMGTNKPVKISDAKSGIIRRLIDVHPTGVLIPANHYNTLMAQIEFELGAIAQHCLNVYRKMGKNYYNAYRPVEMMFQTDVFFNFIEAHYDIFSSQDYTSLKQAYVLYKEWASDAGLDRVLPQYKVREELRNYFDEFHDRFRVEGADLRSVYSGFNANKFKTPKNEATFSLAMEETKSLLDDLYSAQPAQGSKTDEFGDEIPAGAWKYVKTTLADIDTADLHFVKIPEKHLIIDFDLKDENGNKSLERNLEAASVWPATYAELSQGGAGVHLHYNYEGDQTLLSAAYSEGIEVKTLLGDASLRRRLTKCNNTPVATLNKQLPVKEKKMLSSQTMNSERGLRDLISRNLKKEIHPGTKPSIDFIAKILDDAYESGMSYDVTDMRNRILVFANNSTNQPVQSLRIVQRMKFQSKDAITEKVVDPGQAPKDDRIIFYDVEVYQNLFVICWKFQGSPTVVRMINPNAQEVEELFRFKLVGFNNRRYDNHILYGRYLGYNLEQLYKLSQKLIDNERNGNFGEAYKLSYTDIYDFSSVKQSLKKFEIELGITHMELDIPWDQPVPPELWAKVADYCANDVMATEAVFEARKQDFVARQILADLSGLTVNDTTQKHTAQIIFNGDRTPQSKFIYTDLSKDFPGYKFDLGKSTYRDEAVNEGGYVYSRPGMYSDVGLLDIASMHPTSIIQLNLFGPYTPNFQALLDARLAIKHGDYDSAKKMLDGKLIPHLHNPADADALAYALKIVINIVYGLTAARFENPFKDVRNKDNIVAKRGALFMVDLKNAASEEGLEIVHIKTDSVKIPMATPEDIDKIIEFGAKYGYTFEYEATFERFCLVNDAVYIARKDGKWEATGAQFAHPYVFKTLFSGEPIMFDDLCETKQVAKGAIYMDFEHDRPPSDEWSPEDMKFVGRIGRFVPVQEGQSGAVLYRVNDGKKYAVTGTKGHLWVEAEMAATIGDDLKIDMTYFDDLADEAKKAINKFGDFEEFVR